MKCLIDRVEPCFYLLFEACCMCCAGANVDTAQYVQNSYQVSLASSYRPKSLHKLSLSPYALHVLSV
jgi:hypothetical protein